MNQFVEDLSNLLKKLELSKVILLGFSDGANIAMKFTIKYPEKVKLNCIFFSQYHSFVLHFIS